METNKVKVVVADPTTLGLFGLAMVTLVASSQKLGITDGIGLLVPWAVFLGGVAQIIASIFDFKHNNLFGATAFCAYGLFWIGMAWGWMTSAGFFGPELAAAVDPRQLGFVFIGYGILSVVLAVSAVRMSKVMLLDMALIVLLFVSLALDAFGAGHAWHTVAAWTELAISLVTFYALAAKYLSGFFGRSIMPVGKPVSRS